MSEKPTVPNDSVLLDMTIYDGLPQPPELTEAHKALLDEFVAHGHRDGVPNYCLEYERLYRRWFEIASLWNEARLKVRRGILGGDYIIVPTDKLDALRRLAESHPPVPETFDGRMKWIERAVQSADYLLNAARSAGGNDNEAYSWRSQIVHVLTAMGRREYAERDLLNTFAGRALTGFLSGPVAEKIGQEPFDGLRVRVVREAFTYAEACIAEAKRRERGVRETQ